VASRLDWVDYSYFIGTFIQNWKNVRLGSGINLPMGGLESQISAGESNLSKNFGCILGGKRLPRHSQKQTWSFTRGAAS
jgi:hypothetical protein